MYHFGIILKNNSLKKKVFSVIDNQLGRIECIIKNIQETKSIINGALIQYEITKWKSLFILSEVEIISVPKYFLSSDILFLHHILEICLFFIPINYNFNTEKIFSIIKQAYLQIENNSDIHEKAYLIKDLFINLEIHPDESYFKNSNFISLISSDIGNSLNLDKNKKILSNLKLWLNACINTHPFAHKINTLSFLNLLDNNE